MFLFDRVKMDGDYPTAIDEHDPNYVPPDEAAKSDPAPTTEGKDSNAK